MEYFNLEGKIPFWMGLLNMCVIGELIKGAHHLRTLIGISSYPFASLGFRALIMFSTSLVDVYFNRIFGYEVSRLLSSTDESLLICVLLDLRVMFSRLSAAVRK